MENMQAEHLCKSYGEMLVLNDVSYCFRADKITCIMGESGVGKTTFLRLLMGLEKADSGRITGNEQITAAFQEDRLIGHLNAIENVALVLKGKNAYQYAKRQLMCLLPKEALLKPVSGLSKGMCRRVALVRAMAADSRVVLLDEPFTGLDEENVKKAAEYVVSVKRGRIVVIVTHNSDVCKMLGADICLLTTDNAVATML